MVPTASLDDEEVFVPPSLSRAAAMSPPYSPQPLNDVLEDGNSELVLPSVVMAPPVEPSLKRPREVKRARRRKPRKTRASATSSLVVREGKKIFHDRFYSQRFESVATLDSSLQALIEECGVEWFKDKKILEIDCGVGFASFYIAAYLGATRVTAIDRHPETVLGNCAQLRKFKHDGVPVASEKSEPYPQLCVRRAGVARITNKPWFLDEKFVLYSNDRFPFNIEFRCCDRTEEKFDVVLHLGSGFVPGDALEMLSDGGFLAVRKPSLGNPVPSNLVLKNRVHASKIFVYEKIPLSQFL
jgi:SAM-dependent methyltransferase